MGEVMHALVPQARQTGIDDVRRGIMLTAQRECRWLATSEDALPPADAALIGVRRRGICTKTMLDVSRELIEEAIEDGVEYRVLPELSADLLIADDVALVSGGNVLAPALVSMLADYFELLWAKAVPLTGGGGQLSVTQRRIMRLAAAGLKDEAIARSLGLSPRSVRRHMEKLAQRAGATNRLTLGIAVARLGWI